MKVLFAPHSDDETLFATAILMTHRPHVVICYGSERDYGTTDERTEESRKAMALLGVGPVVQWDGGDLVALMRAFDATHAPEQVYAPALPASHPHHVAVGEAAATVFGDRLVRYHTYDGLARVRQGARFRFGGTAARLKRDALACYVTQRTHPRASVFYDEAVFELDEYVDVDPHGAVIDFDIGLADGADDGTITQAEAPLTDGDDEPDGDEPQDAPPSALPGDVTSQPTPPVTTRISDTRGKKRKGGKDRR